MLSFSFALTGAFMCEQWLLSICCPVLRPCAKLSVFWEHQPGTTFAHWELLKEQLILGFIICLSSLCINEGNIRPLWEGVKQQRTAPGVREPFVSDRL